MESVKTVGTAVEKAYNGDGLTVACQVRKHLFELLGRPNLHFTRNRMVWPQVNLFPTSISTFYLANSRVTSSNPTERLCTPP
jgi:hypothetical protein